MALIQVAQEKGSQSKIFSTVFHTKEREIAKKEGAAVPNLWYQERQGVNENGEDVMVPIPVPVINGADGLLKVLGFYPTGLYTYGFIKEKYIPGMNGSPARGGGVIMFPPVPQAQGATQGVPFGEGTFSMGDVDFFMYNLRDKVKSLDLGALGIPVDVISTLADVEKTGTSRVFSSMIGYQLTGVALVEDAPNGNKTVEPVIFRFDSLSAIDWLRSVLMPVLQKEEAFGLMVPRYITWKVGDSTAGRFAGLRVPEDGSSAVYPIQDAAVAQLVKDLMAKVTTELEPQWIAGFSRPSITQVDLGDGRSIPCYTVGVSPKYYFPTALFVPRADVNVSYLSAPTTHQATLVHNSQAPVAQQRPQAAAPVRMSPTATAPVTQPAPKPAVPVNAPSYAPADEDTSGEPDFGGDFQYNPLEAESPDF